MSLPRADVHGHEVAVADRLIARALGLAFLDRVDAGAGLLIPGCRSVHTFGMRFRLDLIFLDSDLRVVAARRAVPPRRFASCRLADSVLELPAGGEEALPGD
jgi:uncharacterized membrane protein (UPF0127 family)